MFFDSDSWPPAPDGHEPKPPPIDAKAERKTMVVVSIVLLAVFLGPFAGTSIIGAVWALLRAL